MIDPYKRFDPQSEGFTRELEDHFRRIVSEITRPMSGTTAERPADLFYTPWFDKTLGKVIVHNGTTWVNADGTAL